MKHCALLPAKVLPADLEDLATHALTYLSLPTWCQLLICTLKYGPARKMFCTALAKTKHHHHSPASLHALLSTLAHGLEDVSMSAWSQNLSRGVGHHSGWLPLLQRLGFLRKLGRSPAHAKRKVLHLGEGKQSYTIVPLAGNPLLKRKLQQVLDLNSISMTPPTTWREWCDGNQQLLRAFNAQPALTGPAVGYSQLWLARSYMFLLRRRLSAARSKLHVTADVGKMTVRKFASMAPDQGDWVHRFCKRAGVAKALKQLNYRGPLELFSMKLCLYASQHVTWGSAHVNRHRKLLLQLMRDYRIQHGISPHPAMLQSLAIHAQERNRAIQS